MPTTNQDVAALRALLTKDQAEHERLWTDLHDRDAKEGYFRLLLVAFNEAAEHRFLGKKRGDIIEWVADVRARTDPNDRIDPDVAERLILWAFGKASTDDLSFETRALHQTVLLVRLVEERELDEAGLDSFLAEARAIADEIAP